MVGGRVLFSDSTHLKENANKKKLIRQQVLASTQAYIEDLNEAVVKDREEQGKKPLKVREEAAEEKEIKISTTDSESGYMYNRGCNSLLKAVTATIAGHSPVSPSNTIV
ncbi:MAG: transposase [Firmicutes bacterium]|nr:transposase [Bacillota bacterium]